MSTTIHSHDHEHEHPDHCSCGHDHEHHDHCSCGHDHEHHDHCSCGHDHEHHNHCSCGHDHEYSKHISEKHGSHVYILENLGCAHCAARMEEKISTLPGISNVSVTFATKQLRFSSNHPEKLLPEIQAICASIESQVKVVNPIPVKHTEHPSEETSHSLHHKKEQIEIFTGAAIFVLGLLLQHTGSNEFLYASLYIAGYLILGHGIIIEAIRNIGHGQIFDENFLMCLATIAAFFIREYPEAMGIMLFYRIGELFEHKAVERSRSQIMDALDLRPETVNLLRSDSIETVPAEQVIPGEILLIRPGDRIPLDGKVLEGTSRIDTSPLTGEPVPVSVKPGDSLLSGCVNTSGQLKMLVEKPLQESMVTRILHSVEHAAASKPQIDRFITRFAKVYTPFVVFAAFATAIIPSLFTGNWNYWLYTAISFLVMSCPCALVLSVPLAFFSGIGSASQKGILFKGGVSIEALSKVKAVIMDKTGTITNGDFNVQKVVSLGAYSESDLLRICAACEQTSTHPIAHSILSAALEANMSAETVLSFESPHSMKEFAGHGIIAELSVGTVLCGNRNLLKEYGIRFSSSIPDSLSGTEVFVAVNGNLEGYLLISDTLKTDASSAVHLLNTQGLHTAMLTGDSEENANAIAERTGIQEVFARLLPQDKLHILQQIRQKHGAVMFVGDGINDAPVLAGADVGAAMGSGADAAIEAADVVFMNSTVTAIVQAITTAKYTYRIAVQNVVFALVIKLGVMLLGLLGFANMWMAVFADTGVAMLCVLNSIRILYKKNK